MAKKKDNEDSLFIGLGGLLLGAAIASPNTNEVAKIQEYKNNELLFQHFKNNFAAFQAYSVKTNQEKKLIAALGKIRIKQQIRLYPEEHKLFNEAIKLYISEFYRFSSIACAMVIENILKKQFGKMSFAELISKADSENLISKNDRKYMAGLRLDRNDYVHSTEHISAESDAKLVIFITIRLLNNILK